MEHKLPKQKQTYAEKVRPQKGGRSLKNSSDPHANWPATLGEIMEWYSHEVEDVTRATQLRLQSATKVIDGYRMGELGFAEAVERVYDHDMRWGQKFPGGIEDSIRGKSDEEVEKQLAAAKPVRTGRG